MFPKTTTYVLESENDYVIAKNTVEGYLALGFSNLNGPQEEHLAQLTLAMEAYELIHHPLEADQIKRIEGFMAFGVKDADGDILTPKCTCRDDQKSRPLCPVCDKEKYNNIKDDPLLDLKRNKK